MLKPKNEEVVDENSITKLMKKMEGLNDWIMIGGLISLGEFLTSYGEKFSEYQIKGHIFFLSAMYILFIIPLVLIFINGLSIKKSGYKINGSTYLSIKRIMIISGIMVLVQLFFNELIQGSLMVLIFLDAWSVLRKINKLKAKI